MPDDDAFFLLLHAKRGAGPGGVQNRSSLSSSLNPARPFAATMPAPVRLALAQLWAVRIDRSFIVLAETKFSFRCIPVWDRYSPHRTRVGKKTHVIMLSP